MPSITQLEYVLAVDEFKNFSKAAAHCSVAQPSLSIQINKLEDELGFMVFDRSKKPILVTEEGEKLLKQAKAVLTEHKKLYTILEESNELSGEFNLALIPTISPYLIPLFIRDLSEKFPDMKLNISEMKTEDIIKALKEDKIDAGILATPLNDDTLIERVLYYEDFYIYASQDHKLLRNEKVSSKSLEDNDLWILEEGHCLRDQVAKVCSLKEKSQNKLSNIRFQSGNLETLIRLINKAHGYTLVPQLAIDHLKKRDRERNLRSFKSPVPSREISMVYSRSFYKEKYIDAIEELIIEKIPKELKSPKKKFIIPIS